MMRRLWVIAFVTMFCFATLVSAREKKPHLIQVALLLDTSNSMDGLIDQAKSQLWKVVNEFATTRKDGQIPELHVALFEYGNDRLPGKEGYIRMVLPLTTDLDKVSEELFALKTNGGSEYCGQVIKKAADTLAWSASNEDLKTIFIAGNEPFTQGGVDYRKACKTAIAKGAVVNTIHCGGYDQGVKGQWKHGAMLADGKYMNIDQNRKVVHIAAPQDREITRLNVLLNKTYIPYGAKGRLGYARQAEQDSNASRHSRSTILQRSAAKASVQYRNTNWDLVDALEAKTIRLADLKKKDLPEAMRGMTLEERRAYIMKQARQRADVQTKIRKLHGQRSRFVAEEMKKQAKTGPDTFDAALIKCVRALGVKKNYIFQTPKP